MEEVEYKDNEKVLCKTSVILSLSHKRPEEVDCFVTENHVVIDAHEPIKIPVSLVKDFHIHSFPDYSHYSTQVQGPHYIA